MDVPACANASSACDVCGSRSACSTLYTIQPRARVFTGSSRDSTDPC